MNMDTAVFEGINEFFPQLPAADTVINQAHIDAFSSFFQKDVSDFSADCVVVDRVILKVNVSFRLPERVLYRGEGGFAVHQHFY